MCQASYCQLKRDNFPFETTIKGAAPPLASGRQASPAGSRSTRARPKAPVSGKSLLPAGVTSSSKPPSERGTAVVARDSGSAEVARGLSTGAATDARRIASHKSHEIETLLGYRGREEMSHRDGSALFASS